MMEFVTDFMNEWFEEHDTLIKIKIIWYRFKNSRQYINSIRGKNKHDYFLYSTFMDCMKKEKTYKKHWKYGHCLLGALKDRNGDLCDFIEQ